eukprot:TRINITY_DN385_c0_g1_i1.p1 TRINITY_DN385_c0_g1~~TRINITY_DN385_c0_g1_i1.p1  ORF type:complete len:369 (-),score=71.83 TRINITY_DN385_c0_g1_i1:25-1131(-)
MSLMGWISNKNTRTVDQLCESPTTRQEYEALAAKTLEECLQLAEGPGWSLINHGYDSDVRLYDKTEPGSPVNFIKTEAIFEASPQEVMDLASVEDFNKRRQWEPELKHFEVVEVISPSISVIYQQYSAPYPVQDRDFVAFKAVQKLPDGVLISFGTSINHPRKPPNKDQCVRGVGLSALILKPIEGEPFKTLTIRIIRLDPMGMIPKFVINLGRNKAVLAVIKFQNYVKKNTPADRAPPAASNLAVVESQNAPRSSEVHENNLSDSSESSEFFDTEEYEPSKLYRDTETQQQLEKLNQLLKELNDKTQTMNDKMDKLQNEIQEIKVNGKVSNMANDKGIINWKTLVLVVGVAGGYLCWKKLFLYKRVI